MSDQIHIICISCIKIVFQLLETRKMRVLVSDLPDVDHFNLTENLADGNFTITREIIETAKGLGGKIYA